MNRLAVMCLILCAVAPLCAAEGLFAGLEKGVRGVAWGEQLSERADMTYNSGDTYFQKAAEDLRLPVPGAAAVTLTRIWYYADAAGGFAYCIAFAPAASTEDVRRAVVGAFGEPKRAGGRAALSVWKSGVVTLGAAFDGSVALTIKRPPQRVPPAK